MKRVVQVLGNQRVPKQQLQILLHQLIQDDFSECWVGIEFKILKKDDSSLSSSTNKRIMI